MFVSFRVSVLVFPFVIHIYMYMYFIVCLGFSGLSNALGGVSDLLGWVQSYCRVKQALNLSSLSLMHNVH